MNQKKAHSKVSSSEHPSPFFRRSYGGFTDRQIEFYSKYLDPIRKQTIFDPMGGQAVALSRLAWQGHKVWVGDINPALSFMASLRDPSLVQQRAHLSEYLRDKLKVLNRRRRKIESMQFIDAWFPASVRADLKDFAEMVSLPLFDDPFDWTGNFWESSKETQFAIGIVLLSARLVACSRTTDNPTWSKPGGLAREARLAPSVLKSLALWESYAQSQEIDSAQIGTGRLLVRRTNVSKGILTGVPKAHAVITSPPYANRLDYTKLWAPESEALGILCNRSMEDIRKEQLGTTVMRGKRATLENKTAEPLCEIAERTLQKIKTDKSAYSDNYYYPFFRSYAEDLTTCLKSTAGRLRDNGVMVIFVRDTVRKDILFPTGQIVVDVLKHDCGFDLVDEHREIIKSHVGQLRQQSKAGFYGLAQQEWWLSFRKSSS